MMVLTRLLGFALVVLTTTAFMPHMARKMQAAHHNIQLAMSQININMPALSSTMKEGKIVSWNKKVGDKVNSGDVLLVVESDKADMDVESFEGGYLAAIYTPEGKSALVGSVVAVLVENAADIGKVSASPSSGATAAAPAVPAAAPVPASPAASKPSAPAANAPEFEQIAMPALSSTMKQGKIVSWSKKVGDKVSSGDVMLVVESDKADMDVESFEEGYLASIAVKDGEIATVGAPVGYLAKYAADIPAVQAYLKSGGSAPVKEVDSFAGEPFLVIPPAKAAAAPSGSTPAAPVVVNAGRVSASGYAQQVAKQEGINLATVTPSRPDGYIIAKDLASGSHGAAGGAVSSDAGAAHVPAAGTINASPTARKLAQEHGVDVTKLHGSGNFGRVMPDDVLKAAGKYVAPKTAPAAAAAAATPSAAAIASSGGTVASGASAAAVLDGLVPMDGMQKAVAKNMEKTLTVPVFRVSREIVTDEFDALYAKLKDKGVTVSALLAKAVAEVLKKHPLINAAYDPSGAIKYNKDINVAMAVAIDGGLITPTLVKASEQDLFALSRAWKDLVARAKAKKLTPAEYTSGTFTISNLGMFGVQQFGAILPPGTGSILAIASSQPRVVQLKNGHFGVQKSMTVTITCDHRHIYGADAAEFLRDLADLLENNVQSLTMG